MPRRIVNFYEKNTAAATQSSSSEDGREMAREKAEPA
jgi:hypothetical protein